MEESECVHESCFDQSIDALALLLRKSVLTFICLWICEVLRRMSDIEIAAEYDRFLFLELFHESEKGWIPVLVPQRESCEIGFGVWCIYRDHKKILIFSRDYTPLLIR